MRSTFFITNPFFLITIIFLFLCCSSFSKGEQKKIFTPDYKGVIHVKLKKKSLIQVDMQLYLNYIEGGKWNKCRYTEKVSKKIKGNVIHFTLHLPPSDPFPGGQCRALSSLTGSLKITLGKGNWIFKSKHKRSLKSAMIIKVLEK